MGDSEEVVDFYNTGGFLQDKNVTEFEYISDNKILGEPLSSDILNTKFNTEFSEFNIQTHGLGSVYNSEEALWESWSDIGEFGEELVSDVDTFFEFVEGGDFENNSELG